MVQHFRCKQVRCNAKRSMLQENKWDAACMYVHASFDKYSNRHIIGLLLCAGVITLRCAVPCYTVLAVLL